MVSNPFIFLSKVRQALGGIPIVDDEIRRAAGTASESATEAEDESAVKMAGGAPKQLVTADGTYASQSAFSAASPASRYSCIRHHVGRSVGRSAVTTFHFLLSFSPIQRAEGSSDFAWVSLGGRFLRRCRPRNVSGETRPALLHRCSQRQGAEWVRMRFSARDIFACVFARLCECVWVRMCEGVD